MPWTEFRPFTDFIDIHPFVGVPPGEGNDIQTTIGEHTGGFSTDEGLRPVPGGLLDFDMHWPLALGLYWIRIDSKAAKGKTNSGYFDYIGQSRNLNPQGRRATFGIFRRIQAHYLKILRLPQRGDFWGPGHPKREELAQQDFEDYREFRDFFRDEEGNLTYSGGVNFDEAYRLLTKHHDLDTHEQVKDFFKKHVSLRFLNLIRGNNQQERIRYVERVRFAADVKKGEAVSLLNYCNHFKETPYLNSKKEFEHYLLNFWGDDDRIKAD